MTNARETNESKKQTARTIAFCVVLAMIITVGVLACKMRMLSAELQRLDATYQEAIDRLRETTNLLEARSNDFRTIIYPTPMDKRTTQ